MTVCELSEGRWVKERKDLGARPCRPGSIKYIYINKWMDGAVDRRVVALVRAWDRWPR